MTGFIIMTVITVAFGAVLFYSIFKSVDDVEAPSQEALKNLFGEKFVPVFPQKVSRRVVITNRVLDIFKDTDGFYPLSQYHSMTLQHRVYDLENDSTHVANVFLLKDSIVAVFLSHTDLLQFVEL